MELAAIILFEVVRALMVAGVFTLLAAALRFIIKAGHTLNVVNDVVVPRFQQPTVREQMDGKPDLSMPTQLATLRTEFAEHVDDDRAFMATQRHINRAVTAALTKGPRTA